MSNLEHLIENGLSALKRGVSYEKWLKIMKDDVNWQDNENISIEQLWTICQYVIYTWIPSAESEPKRGKKGKWMKLNDIDGFVRCSSCGTFWDESIIDTLHFHFCPNCGLKMEE